MSRNAQILVRLALTLAFILSVAGLHYSFAQSTLAGEWKASMDKEGSGKLHLSFERYGAEGQRSQTGLDYDFADLQGLTREQVQSGGPVKFSLVREAGRIDLEGSFENGRGSGTFRFTGNQSFVAAMKTRGFDFDSSANGVDPKNRLFVATALNITEALADDLMSAGLGKLDVEDLVKAAIFKVDSKFAREMKSSGFQNLGMEELVKARIFKIDAAFASEVAQMGFSKEPFENLVKMRIFKVTPEFIADLRNEGLTGLSVKELVKMRIFNIDTNFIRQAKAEGVPLEVERLVEKRIGVRTRERN